MPIKVKSIVQAAIVGLLIVIIMRLWSRPSMFALSPADLMIRGTNGDPSALFSIRPDLKCVPGPSAQADYYTSGLTPGGLCGGMNFVHSQQRDYSITDGVGGSLLSK